MKLIGLKYLGGEGPGGDGGKEKIHHSPPTGMRTSFPSETEGPESRGGGHGDLGGSHQAGSGEARGDGLKRTENERGKEEVVRGTLHPQTDGSCPGPHFTGHENYIDLDR